MKKLLLLALLGASACAHAQDKVNSPNFQGAARSNLDMGGHSVIGAGAVSIGSGSGAVSVSASSGGLNVSGAGGTGGVTIQGNTFNAANQLVKLDGGGMLLPQFLPKATSSILGAVKIGGGLAVAGDGTLSLPVASASVLGGVKIGSGLAIDGSAILSLDASATTQGNAFNAPGKLVKLNTDQYFIFEGDSITAGAFATHPFSYYFASMSFASGRGTIINDAVSGSTISPGSGSGNNVSDRYNSNVKPYRPSASGGSGGATAYLFLMIGTNDIGNLGNTGSQVITALGTYCAQARSDGFTLVLSTITPRTSAYGWTATMEGYRQQVNSAIRNGTIPCDILIDYAAALSNPADTGLYYDGLHPLDAGQQVLARYLNGVMAGKGAGVPATPGYTDVPFAGMNFTGPITFPQNSKLTDGSSNTLSFFSSGSIPSGPSFGVSTANVYLDAAGGSSSEIGIGKNHTGSKILLRGYELNADTEHGMTLNSNVIDGTPILHTLYTGNPIFDIIESPSNEANSSSATWLWSNGHALALDTSSGTDAFTVNSIYHGPINMGQALTITPSGSGPTSWTKTNGSDLTGGGGGLAVYSGGGNLYGMHLGGNAAGFATEIVWASGQNGVSFRPIATDGTTGSVVAAIYGNGFASFGGDMNDGVNALQVNGTIRIGSSPPANATSSGVAGTITWDSSYIYVCTATNTWKRAALSSW